MSLKLKLRASAERNTLKVGDEVFESLAALLARHPEFGAEASAADLAIAANHLLRGSDYEVILDPAAFEAAYRARIAGEDLSQGYADGDARLSDFGLPDFAQIAVPRIAGDQIAYFARDALTGLPYRATASLTSDAAEYLPLALTAIARPGPTRQVPPPDAAMPDIDEDADPEGVEAPEPDTSDGATPAASVQLLSDDE
ncbi:hypothetical protein GC209_17965 [bacterium]|nr:hypothetical protein [bacterium]